ncbi:MAG: bifunctional folylpolyglutamate synthase/dihydrofolate synthase [Heyndrickxia sp.]
MTTIQTMHDAENLIYQSYLRAHPHIQKVKDEEVRKPALTRKLLNSLGSPDKNEKYVLVTGSKGKGSTSMILASLLQFHGLKVGLFTSPHLISFNERIRINGTPIPNEDFTRFSNNMLPAFTKIEKDLSSTEYQGPVGLALAIAVMYFKEQKTDINIIECGRGGKYDDTNVLSNEWAILTSIMKEHTLQLGPTIYDIAKHKLGIVKEATQTVIIGKLEPFLKKYISQQLQSVAGDLRIYDKDFSAGKISVDKNGTSFNVSTALATYAKMKFPLLGTFQAYNAATAISACEAILHQPLKEESIIRCFGQLEWPGRCEIIAQNPTVIVDGAINRESAQYVKEVIQSFGKNKVISIVGVPHDKDYKGVIDIVASFSEKIFVSKPDISHLTFPSDALAYAKTIHNHVDETEWLEDAVNLVKKDSFDILLIIGTQTFIGNAKRIYMKKQEPSN